MEQETRQRIVFGGAALIVIAICIALAKLFFFRALIGIGVTLIGGAAAWEFYLFAERKGMHIPTRLGVAASLFYLVVAFCCAEGWLSAPFQGLALALAALVLFGYFFFRGEQPLVTIPVLLFGLLYGGVCIGFVFTILSGPSGQWWLTYLLAVAIATDVGAYFVGKQWGGRRLAPKVSPGKSWEGAVGGFIVGVLAGVVVYLIAPDSVPFSAALVYGCILSIVTQIGDLSESLFKRDVGVKDSSSIPNFGGVLDVVDGLLFVLPIGYLFTKL